MIPSSRSFLLCLFNICLSTAAVAAPKPQITAVSPITIPGQRVILSGTGFGIAKDMVLVGGIPAFVNTWGSTEISVTLPPIVNSTTISVCVTGVCSDPMPILIPAVVPAGISTPTFDNGIFVSGLEQYDDATLQMLLDATRIKLASLQVLDSTSILGHVGTSQGASSQMSGFALNIGGPSIPGTVTTANSGGTTTSASNGTNLQQNSGSTTTTSNSGSTAGNSAGTSQSTGLQIIGPSAQSTLSGSNQSQTTSPSSQIVTTRATMAPISAPTPTMSGFTLPSGFNPSASDVLNEQLQLTSEIAGYQLLLEGSLTNRYMLVSTSAGVQQYPRKRVTIGIPVDIRNTGDHRDEAAEITLSVGSLSGSMSPDRPIVTTILPQEKTYNVAAVTNHSASIGGGFVSSMLSVGATWLWGHQTYYVVKDQDVVAYQLASSDSQVTNFGWDFRPTLGRHYVTEGMRRVYVQLAFPDNQGGRIGAVTVKTAWKKYDRKKGVIAKGASDKAATTYSIPFYIEDYDLRPQIGQITANDNADGTINLVIAGAFAPGTTLQSGPHVYGDGSGGYLRTEQTIQAIVPESDVTAHPMHLLDRSGASIDVVDPSSLKATSDCFKLGVPSVTTQTSSTALVKIPVSIDKNIECAGNGADNDPALSTDDLVAAVGSHIIGFRDSPFAARDTASISLLVPSDWLRANSQIVVARPLWGPRYSASTIVDLGASLPTISQATIVEQSAAVTKIVLAGTALSKLVPIFPAGITIEHRGGTNAIIAVPPTSLDGGTKQLVFDDGFGGVLLVAAPNLEKGPSLTAHAPIKVGSLNIRVEGSGLSDLAGISYDGQPLQYSPKPPTKDTKAITVILPSTIRSRAGTYQLSFTFNKSPSANYAITVFDTLIIHGDQSTTVTTGSH